MDVFKLSNSLANAGKISKEPSPGSGNALLGDVSNFSFGPTSTMTRVRIDPLYYKVIMDDGKCTAPMEKLSICLDYKQNAYSGN